jgi:hypothetical protein
LGAPRARPPPPRDPESELQRSVCAHGLDALFGRPDAFGWFVHGQVPLAR